MRDREASRAPAGPEPEPAPAPARSGATISNRALSRLLGRPGPIPVDADPAAERAAGAATDTTVPPGVTVHTGAAADQAAAAAGSVAFTYGREVVLSRAGLDQSVLAHELHHAAGNREMVQRFGGDRDTASALNSSLTAQAVGGMPDATAQSELYESGVALARTDLPEAERRSLRDNRDLLENEVKERRLPTAVPVPGRQAWRHPGTGAEFTDDPAHARWALETLVVARGSKVAAQVVADLQELSTAEGQYVDSIRQMNDVSRFYDPARQAEPAPTYPAPALAGVVGQQWRQLKAENDEIIREATKFGNALMAEALANSLQQASSEARRYAWVSNEQSITTRSSYEQNLAEEKRLGTAAGELTAKHKRVLAATKALAGGETAEKTAEQQAARADLLTAELALTKEFPVLASYVSKNDWDDLADLAADPTGWEYGGRVKRTLLNILEVKEALADGDTSCWKQDRIVGLMMQYQGIAEGTLRARVYADAVEAAHEDPWWKTALTFVAIGLSLLAAIPSGGSSLLVAGALLTVEAAALGLDLYLLSEAYADYSLDKAAAGTDFDVAQSISSSDPSAVWLVVQILATGVGAAGAARSFARISQTRAALRAASGSDEVAAKMAQLGRELDEAGVPAAAKQRALQEAVEEAGTAGLRPELVNRASAAPLENTPTGVAGQNWEVRRLTPDDIKGKKPAEYPDVKEGQVLIFPNGYRVWRLPGGAVVEEQAVTASMSGFRKVTQGEEALQAAGEAGPAHAAAGTHRAHGAGAPGLGFDASYGVVHAPRKVNLVLENMGLEQFVRNLRDNAPKGVQYLYRTTTYATKDRLNLVERVYRISATVDGQVHDMYEFAIRMKPGAGLGDDAVEFAADEVEVFAGATRFGAKIDPPDVLARALERGGKAGKETVDALVSKALGKVDTLTAKLEKVEARLAAKSDVAGMQALDELTETVGRLRETVAHGPVDRVAFERLNAELERFYRRASRWPDLVEAGELRAFTRELNAQLKGR